MKKRSISDLVKNAAPVTAKQRAKARLEFAKTIMKMRSDFERAKASPQWRAMGKLEASLRALRADPAINVSSPCSDLLDTVIDLLDLAWPHHSVEAIVQPLQKHFDHVKSVGAVTEKYAKDPKQAAKAAVKKQWEKWQSSPDEWGSKRSFAEDMQKLYPILKSEKGVSITRWCLKWERGED